MHPASLPHPALLLPHLRVFWAAPQEEFYEWVSVSISRNALFFVAACVLANFNNFFFTKTYRKRGKHIKNQIGKGKSSLTHMKPAGGRRYCYFPGGHTNQRAGVKPSRKWIAWIISFWRWWVLQLYPLEVEFDFLLNALDPQRRRPLFWRKGLFHQQFQGRLFGFNGLRLTSGI